LAVIAIVGVLAALLLVVIGRARESSRISRCIGNLREIGIGYGLYLQDNRQVLPPYWNPTVMPSRLSAIAPYVEARSSAPNKGVFACPTAQDSLASEYAKASDRNSYHQNRAWSGFNNSPTDRKSVLTFSHPSQAILVYERWGAADQTPPEPNTHASVRNVLFVDLHVESRADLQPSAALSAALKQE